MAISIHRWNVFTRTVNIDAYACLGWRAGQDDVITSITICWRQRLHWGTCCCVSTILLLSPVTNHNIWSRSRSGGITSFCWWPKFKCKLVPVLPFILLYRLYTGTCKHCTCTCDWRTHTHTHQHTHILNLCQWLSDDLHVSFSLRSMPAGAPFSTLKLVSWWLAFSLFSFTHS